MPRNQGAQHHSPILDTNAGLTISRIKNDLQVQVRAYTGQRYSNRPSVPAAGSLRYCYCDRVERPHCPDAASLDTVLSFIIPLSPLMETLPSSGDAVIPPPDILRACIQFQIQTGKVRFSVLPYAML